MEKQVVVPSQLNYESNPPQIVALLRDRNSEMYSKTVEIYRKVKDILDTRISQVFPDYTLHNGGHSLRIMNYMGYIVPDLEQLSDLEITLLIYSALLHDVGMGASKEEVQAIKNGNLQYKNLKYEAFLRKFNNDHTQAIQDYIRRVHAIRSSEYIKNNFKDSLFIPEMPNTSFEDELALICQAHTEDVSWISKNLTQYSQKGIYTYNSLFCAMVLRMADILDFDSERTPPVLFKTLNPQGISKEEWEQHFTIDNASKISLSKEGGQKEIELFGRCNNSGIHRKVLKYIDWINDEIDNINTVTRSMEPKYRINLSPKVNNQIKSEGYTFADLRFNVNFKQVTRLLMGEQIYGEKRLGLRELIQNAIDACKTRKEIEDSTTQFGYDEYRPVIKIMLDKSMNQVIINDNGTGMTLEILKKYFLNMGSSFYTSDEFVLRDLKHKPIGNYGIGFLACFMLSDKVTVKTRHFQNSFKYEVELLKEDEYVSIKENEDVSSVGTEIILNYDEFMKVWKNGVSDIQKFLELYFISDVVQIELIDKDSLSRININNPLTSNVDSEKSSSNLLKIDLSEYLDEVEGIVYIKNPGNVLFSEGIEDIPSEGDKYFFNGEELIEFDAANVDVLDLVEDEEIEVLNIPMIEDGDTLDKMVEVMDDIDDAIQRYIDKESPSYVSIVSTKEFINTAKKGVISNTDYIMDELPFDALCDHGQEHDTYTMVDIDKYKIFNVNGTKIFLLLSGKSSLPQFTIHPKHDIDIYVRGVYVKSAQLSLENIIRDLKPDRFKVNISKKEIMPKISRNEFNQEVESVIITSIYQAICFGIYESIQDYVKKSTIKKRKALKPPPSVPLRGRRRELAPCTPHSA